MIHPKTELKFISKEVGHGIVATEFIPAGTITWVLDILDREITPKEFDSMDINYQEIVDTYTYRNKNGNRVLLWDNGRFVNHSFNSNCLLTAYNFEVAIRDIQAGEQLTDDYGYLNIIEPFRGADEGTKRKVVYPDDNLRYHKIWDNQLLNVFDKIPQINQPLKKFMSNELWEDIEAIANKKKKMDSILKNYYADEKVINQPQQ